MRAFFHPRGVVVIGVSPSPANLARRVVLNLVSWKFPGRVVAVGRQAGEVHGVPILDSLDRPDAFEGCDLAVILTPAPAIPALVRRCGELGIRHAIIESSGFSELHHDGSPLEDELVRAARDAGVRFIGPNCVGLMNFDSGSVAAFAQIDPFPLAPPRGGKGADAAILSQSGGVGLCVLRSLAAQGVMSSWVVSMGNKLDVDEVELAEHLLRHEPVGRVLCYLESMSRGRAFVDAVRASDVPVVVHKVNRTATAKRVAQSHTAALANDDAVVSAVLEQAGVIRVRDTREAALAMAATRLPPMRGDRVALVSRSGGHAVIAADACADEGLRLPAFSASLLDDLEALKPASVILRSNPLDFGDIFDFGLMARILERVSHEADLDAVVFVAVYNPIMEQDQGRRLVMESAEISRRAGKPVALAVVTDEAELEEMRAEADFPLFGTSEEAVHALGLLWKREQALRRSRGEPVWGTGVNGGNTFLEKGFSPGPPSPKTVRKFLGDETSGVVWLDRRARVLSVIDSLALVRAAGIPVVEACSAQETGHLSFPVVAKHGAAADQVVHKDSSGMVKCGLRDRASLVAAIAEIERRARDLGLEPEVVVQPQLEGRELFLGARRDPSFGPVVLFGAGGGLVEVAGGVEIMLAPFTLDEVEHRWSRSPACLRVGDRVDVRQVASWLAGLARLLEVAEEIEEIDVNPLLVSPSGPFAVDARVVLSNSRLAECLDPAP